MSVLVVDYYNHSCPWKGGLKPVTRVKVADHDEDLTLIFMHIKLVIITQWVKSINKHQTVETVSSCPACDKYTFAIQLFSAILCSPCPTNYSCITNVLAGNMIAVRSGFFFFLFPLELEWDQVYQDLTCWKE